MNREIPRVIGDAVVFFFIFELILLTLLSEASANFLGAASIGAALVRGGVLITIQALLGLYVERAIFYYIIKPGSLRAASRWVAKGVVLYLIDYALFGILIVFSRAYIPVSGGFLAFLVALVALILLIVQAVGDYIVFRIMAATTRRVR